MTIRIDIRPDLRGIHRAMIALKAEQVPFATALALNDLAAGVRGAETDAVKSTFESPTPFTERAFRIEPATKRDPVAIVAIKDIQAAYLRPYVEGGKRWLGTKKGMLKPVNVGVNRYGNLTRGKLASLKAKSSVTIGAIKTRKGETINGVWQRGKKRELSLLIRFEDTTEAPKRLPFEAVARSYVREHAAAAFDRALRRANETRRRRTPSRRG